jgi:hypothetical protein
MNKPDIHLRYRSVPTEVTDQQIQAMTDFLLSIEEPAPEPECVRCGKPASHLNNGQPCCELCRGIDLD